MLPSTFKVRAALVLLQVAAFVTWEHWERPVGSAVETVFGILVFVALPVALLSAGRLPPLKLMAWPAICSAAVALLCASFLASLKGESGADNFLGFTGLFVECAALFIIGHSFVLASHIDGRIIARYPTYVDVSWTLAAQAIMAGLAFQTAYLLPIVVEKYLGLPIEVPT
ncbi:MAG: hypothetical protein JSR47_05615 [Proteobacteria bacterium]|nr:hypothetical protein [Pseudomonadota bacterium]